MATLNYAEKFLPNIQKKYTAKSKSDFLTTNDNNIKFVDAQTIKVPELKLGGYGDHTRSLGFNTSDYSNTYELYKLAFDRDVEYFIDPMDVDETNTAVSIANLQNEFEDQVAIPERDKYRFSKLYKEAKAKGCAIDNTKPDETTILKKFDAMMKEMDEAEVDEEGRRLVVTPEINEILKNAKDIQRSIIVSGKTNGIYRMVHNLDDVELIVVPSSRLKTKYADKGTGKDKAYLPTDDAKQIYMMLVEPSAVICKDKYAYIRVFTPGSDSRTADGYIYQNRKYGDLFVIKAKKAGVMICAEAES